MAPINPISRSIARASNWASSCSSEDCMSFRSDREQTVTAMSALALVLVLLSRNCFSISTFQDLLGQVKESDFFSESWEHKPLHIKFERPQRYFFLKMSLAEVDDIVRSSSALDGTEGPPRYNRDIKLVRQHKHESGEILTQGFEPPAPHGNVTLGAVHAMFRKGFSLVLNNVNHRHQPVAQLSESVAARFGVKTNANLYLTPAGGKAFDPHMDWMESFVLQIAGRKTWHFHHESRVHRAYLGLVVKPKQHGEPFQSVTLDPGDLLYVPRGLVHEVVAESSEASMHVTLGVEVHLDPI